jgi:HAE1 family hydrophobic/amphiphilic exporter-1
MKEVTGPIIATSLALIAVFVPVAAMGGITGRLYQQFAITIAISVAISSINALTLSPALSAMLLKPPSEQKKSWLQPFYDRFNAVFRVATDRYMGVTTFLTRKTMLSLVGLVGVTVLMTALFGLVPGGFVPEEDQGYFLINVQLPDAASLERTDRVSSKVESILEQMQGIESVTTVDNGGRLQLADVVAFAKQCVFLRGTETLGGSGCAGTACQRDNRFVESKAGL